MNLHWRAHLVGTEVGVADHGDVWLLVEELYGMGRQLGNVHQHVLVGVTVYERVGDVEGALLRVEDVHRGEGLVFGTNAHHLFCHLDGV